MDSTREVPAQGHSQQKGADKIDLLPAYPLKGGQVLLVGPGEEKDEDGYKSNGTTDAIPLA